MFDLQMIFILYIALSKHSQKYLLTPKVLKELTIGLKLLRLQISIFFKLCLIMDVGVRLFKKSAHNKENKDNCEPKLLI